MIEYPDINPDFEDIGLFADWLEISTLLSDTGQVSVFDVADYLHSASVVVGSQDESEWEQAEQVARDGIGRVCDRRRHFGVDYPIYYENDVLVAEEGSQTFLCFLVLLVADIGRYYRAVDARAAIEDENGKDVAFGTVFEYVTCACLGALMRGDTVRFGWPIRDEWDSGNAVRRVQELAGRMGTVAQSPDLHVDGTHKDVGLDVIARVGFANEGAGGLTYLVQCATGGSWRDVKGNEPPIDVWREIMSWGGQVMKGVAVPWRETDEAQNARRLSTKCSGVVFDRLRLMGAPGAERDFRGDSRKLVEGWLRARMGEFPSA